MVAFKLNRPAAKVCADGKPARSPRRRVLLTGAFQSLSGTCRATVRNLSCTGVSVTSDQPLKVGAEGVIQAGPLDSLCRVVWQKGNVYGLQFDQPLPNPLVLELHRVTQQDVQRSELASAKEWFDAQTR